MADSQSVGHQQPQAPGPQTGVKKGLPGRSLKIAEANVEKLWQVARHGAVPHDAYAKELKMKGASGGTWARRLALLRAFGLVEASKTDIRLSPIGLDIVQTHDDEKRQTARRKSFCKVRAYKDLVESYDGTELPEKEQIGSKLEFEFGKTPEAAAEAAAAFIESLTLAGLLDSDRVVRRGGAGSAPLATDDNSTELEDDSAAEELDEEFDEEEFDDEFGETEEPDEEVVRSEGPVSLSMTLDFSRFRADEVIEILAALGLARRPRA